MVKLYLHSHHMSLWHNAKFIKHRNNFVIFLPCREGSLGHVTVGGPIGDIDTKKWRMCHGRYPSIS
jgi:hypothetical protein